MLLFIKSNDKNSRRILPPERILETFCHAAPRWFCKPGTNQAASNKASNNPKGRKLQDKAQRTERVQPLGNMQVLSRVQVEALQ